MTAFPNNPTPGVSHTIGSKTWYWDGTAWTLSMENTPGGGGDGVEPPSPTRAAWNQWET